MIQTFQALCYEDHGKAEEVVQLRQLPLPALGPNELLVQSLATSIHPSDFGKIQGSYGRLPSLPAVAGREGIGEVLEVGRAVKILKPGMYVQLPESMGTWRDFVVMHENAALVVPRSLPIELAAMSFVNPPTAWRLLSDFVPLRPGEWVIQNAATSAVGLCVIQLARIWGLKTINVVRNLQCAPYLKTLGADIVIGMDACHEVSTLTGGAKPKLALNSVGGESALALIMSLDTNGVMVTFGGMTGEKIRFPTRYLIFDNVQLRGFWMDHWIRTRQKSEWLDCLSHVWDLMKRGLLTIPVEATYPLLDWRKAFAHAQQNSRRGKILFKVKE